MCKTCSCKPQEGGKSDDLSGRKGVVGLWRRGDERLLRKEGGGLRDREGAVEG